MTVTHRARSMMLTENLKRMHVCAVSSETISQRMENSLPILVIYYLFESFLYAAIPHRSSRDVSSL